MKLTLRFPRSILIRRACGLSLFAAIQGLLVFRPVRDKAAEPQTISIALDGRKPMSKVLKIVADGLAQQMDEDLTMVRNTATIGRND